MFRLTVEEIATLVRQPESGMGYQVVDVTTMAYQRKRGVVYNSELLALDEDRAADRSLMLRKSARELVLAANSAVGKFRSFKVVSDYRTAVLNKRAAVGTTGASDAEVQATSDDERFYRFSAFENDRRVKADKSLAPGSYATTKSDGDKVKTGLQAVERYALPNDDPASHRFSAATQKGTKIQRGVVQPANGHQGGGIEVIFTDGTQANTVTLPPTKLPDR